MQDRKEMFGREVRNYLLDEEKINAYRSFYGDRPETIFREESNETAKQDEMVRNELIGIDKCFVNNGQPYRCSGVLDHWLYYSQDIKEEQDRR